MKVKELIEQLNLYDPDLEVWIKDHVESNDYELSSIVKGKANITDVSDGYEVITFK